jgi:hypothetical protein
VQVKTGIGRFFGDLTKPPYKTIFNPSVSGAHAFNATVTHRCIDRWIEKKKHAITKKSGSGWGVLVHGNRILSAVVFSKYGKARLAKANDEYSQLLKEADIDALCEEAYRKIVPAVETNYPGKFLAVLFKNPTMSKKIFDIATA